MTTVLKLNLKVSPEKPEKIEIFNFKDKEGKARFKINTTNTTDFTNCLKNNKPVDVQALDWMNILIKHCEIAFPKIRIRSKNIKPSAARQLRSKERFQISCSKPPYQLFQRKDLKQN